jgi:hypothetical protein
MAEVKNDESQKAKDDNCIEYRDLLSPTNSVVRMKMLYTDKRGQRGEPPDDSIITFK